MKTGRILEIAKCWLALVIISAALPWLCNAKVTAALDDQLIKAAAFADFEAVTNLLDRGADVNAKPRSSWTPLMAASTGRYWKVVQVLPEMHEKVALMPAFESGLQGRNRVVKLLLDRGADVNARAADGRTALMFASQLVATDMVETLLDRRAEVNAQAADGSTALMFAVNNAGTDVVKLLLERGADANARDQRGWTVLMRAARFQGGNVPAFSPLQEADDRTTLEQRDRTDFLDAMGRRRSEVVRLLKAHGAEVTLVVAAMLGNTREVRRLLDRGSDVNGTSADGLTALIGAAELGHPNAVTVLVERGADVNVRAMDGATALMRAAQNGHVNVAKLLLEKGAEINLRDEKGRTALWAAVWGGNKDVVELLLEHGADPNSRAKNGDTPLDVAKIQRDPEILELLKARGRKK